MDESTWLDRILAAARQRLGALADPPPLDEESVRRRHDELAQQHPEADASAWEGELEGQVLLALEDVLTPGQWRTVMGSAPFGDGEGELALPLFDSPVLCDTLGHPASPGEAEESVGDPAADAGPGADIGTYGAALWPARAPRGSGTGAAAVAPLGALSGAMLPASVDPDPSDTRRLNRMRRAPGGVESHRPLGPMGACFPEAAASRRPVGDPPDQNLAALPDAILDDLTD